MPDCQQVRLQRGVCLAGLDCRNRYEAGAAATGGVLWVLSRDGSHDAGYRRKPHDATRKKDSVRRTRNAKALFRKMCANGGAEQA